MKLLLAIPALALIGCAEGAPTAPAAAGTSPTSLLVPGAPSRQANTSKSSVPFSFTSCDGRTITGTADRHTVVAFTSTPSGRSMALINTDDKIDAQDPVTGVDYKGKDKTKSQAVSGVEGADVFTVTSRLSLTGHGVPPIVLNISTRVVRNANGDPVVDKTSFSSNCS